jgi:amidase
MYINEDTETDDPIETRESVVALWHEAKAELEALGATVIETDFPAVTRYEDKGQHPHNLVERGLLPEVFADHELNQLSLWAWHDFLDANNDPSLHALKDVTKEKIFPQPEGALIDQYGNHVSRYSPEDVLLEDYVVIAQREGITPFQEIPDIAEGILGLEKARKLDLENWMDELSLDAVVFPAVADVGPADMDINPESARLVR